MSVQIQGKNYYYTSEALEKAGVAESAWRQWLENGDIVDVRTCNRKGWRLFTEEDTKKLKEYIETTITE